MHDPDLSTSAELIEAATRLFSQKGFEATTIRQIATLAGANGASINYHFRDKKTLYETVLKRSFESVGFMDNSPRDGNVEERLSFWVEGLLQCFLGGGDEGTRARGRLVARALFEGEAAASPLAAPFIEVPLTALLGLLRERVGPDVGEREIRLCLASVLAQVLCFGPCERWVDQLFSEGSARALEIKDLARHITRFSLEGIKAWRSEPAPELQRAMEGFDASETEIHLL